MGMAGDKEKGWREHLKPFIWVTVALLGLIIVGGAV